MADGVSAHSGSDFRCFRITQASAPKNKSVNVLQGAKVQYVGYPKSLVIRACGAGTIVTIASTSNTIATTSNNALTVCRDIAFYSNRP